MVATNSQSLYPSAHPQHAYALAILFGGVAYILPQTGIRISQWLTYGLVGVLFGSLWPRKALQWGIWIVLPLAMLGFVDFFASWNIFIVLNSVFLLVRAVLFSCVGAYLGSLLSISRLGRLIARGRHIGDAGARTDYSRASLREGIVKGVVTSSAQNGSGDREGIARLHAALIKAVGENNVMSLKRLIALGADVNQQSRDRVTHLTFAPPGPDSGVMNFLFGTHTANGSNDGGGWTPLMLATIEGHFEVAQVLLAHNADVDAQNDDGWTALRFAVSMDETRILRMLLDAGADPNIIDRQGRTALMQAAAENILASLRILVDAGADPSRRNHTGQSAGAIAQANGHIEAAGILKQIEPSSQQSAKLPFGEDSLIVNSHRVITRRRDPYIGLIDQYDVIQTELPLPSGWEETGRLGPEDECREFAWKNNIGEPSELGWWLVFSS